MKLIKFVICSFIIISSFMQAQVNQNHLFVQQGYTNLLINGFGISNAINNISNISGSNPAAISKYETFEAGISYRFETKINNAIGNKYNFKKDFDAVPYSAGLIYPINDLIIGFGVNQEYNNYSSESAGQYPYQVKNLIMKYSIIGSYSFHEILSSYDELVLGINLNTAQYQTKFSVFGDGFKYMHKWNTSYSTGVLYFMGFSVFNVFYEKGYKFKGLITDKELNGTGEHPDVIIPDASVQGTPDKISYGADIFTPKVIISLNAVHNYWNKINILRKNSTDIAASAFYILSTKNNISGFSIGVLDRSFEFEKSISAVQENNVEYPENFKSIYLTAGVVFHYKTLDFDLALADNHLLRDENTKQTIGKFTIGFHLDR